MPWKGEPGVVFVGLLLWFKESDVEMALTYVLVVAALAMAFYTFYTDNHGILKGWNKKRSSKNNLYLIFFCYLV